MSEPEKTGDDPRAKLDVSENACEHADDRVNASSSCSAASNNSDISAKLTNIQLGFKDYLHSRSAVSDDMPEAKENEKQCAVQQSSNGSECEESVEKKDEADEGFKVPTGGMTHKPNVNTKSDEIGDSVAEEDMISKSSSNEPKPTAEESVDRQVSVETAGSSNVPEITEAVINNTESAAGSSEVVAGPTDQEKDNFGARLVGIGTKMDPSHVMIEITSQIFKMGRSFEADVTIKDINISREQAKFQYLAGSWTILDNSSNGIRVNGRRITKGAPFSLHFQDEILFSDQRDKYFWKFLSITDKENFESLNTRKRKLPQLQTDKRFKFGSPDSTKVPLKLLETERIHREKILRKMEAERIERERAEKIIEEERHHREQVEKKILEERLQREEVERRMIKEREEREQVIKIMEKEREEREEVERKMEKEREEREEAERKMERERELMLREMEVERKERESLARQLKEQKLALEAERNKLEEEMVKLRDEKTRIEEEHAAAHNQMISREEQTKEEMRRKEEENKEKQELILKRIEEERERASMTAEDVQKKESKIAELEMAMEAAKLEADAIILQEKEAREKIASEMEAERSRLEAEKIKLEQEMTNLRAEKDRVEAEKNTKVAEVLEEQEKREADRKMKEEENLAKQQDIMQQIEREKARAATSEEENKLKETRIEELQVQMVAAIEEAEHIKEQGAKEVLSRMEDTLEQQLICPTCLELPVHPVILNCGHSYCWLCLQQWKKISKKQHCPQCRTVITSETRGISMDNMIEAFISQLGPAKVEERKVIVAERCEQENKFRDEEQRGQGGRGQNRGRGRERQRGGRNNRGGGQQEVRNAGPAPNNNAGNAVGMRPWLVRPAQQNRAPPLPQQPNNAVRLPNYPIPPIQPVGGVRIVVPAGNPGQPLRQPAPAQPPQAAGAGNPRPPGPILVVRSSNSHVRIPLSAAATNVSSGGVGGVSARRITVLAPSGGAAPPPPNSARLVQIQNFGNFLAAQASARANAVAAGQSDHVGAAVALPVVGSEVVVSTTAAAAVQQPHHPPPSSQGTLQASAAAAIPGPSQLASRPGSSASSGLPSRPVSAASNSSGSSRPGSAASNGLPSMPGSSASSDSSRADSQSSSSSSSAGSRVIYVSSSDEEDSDNSQNLDSPTRVSETDYDSDESDVPGLPGYYYGGYGHCYACGRTGHWAPGCPF